VLVKIGSDIRWYLGRFSSAVGEDAEEQIVQHVFCFKIYRNKQSGTVEVHRAHNPRVTRSKLVFAKSFSFDSIIFNSSFIKELRNKEVYGIREMSPDSAYMSYLNSFIYSWFEFSQLGSLRT
jgi:hypothetical protein